MIGLIFSSVFIFSGLAVLAVSAAGLFRFSTTLNRVHVLRCDIVGISLVILGFIIFSGCGGYFYRSLKLLSVLVLAWLVLPAAARLAAMTEIMSNPDIKSVCDILRFSQDSGKLVSLDSDIRDKLTEETF